MYKKEKVTDSCSTCKIWRYTNNMMRVTKKQTLRSLTDCIKCGPLWVKHRIHESLEYGNKFILLETVSLCRCHTKRRMGTATFWYDNDKDLKVCFLVMCVISARSYSVCRGLSFTLIEGLKCQAGTHRVYSHNTQRGSQQLNIQSYTMLHLLV